MGLTGLDATASIIFAQLLPVNSNNFKNTINDLNDAGVLISSSSSSHVEDSKNGGSRSDNNNNNNGASVHVELTDVLLSTTSRSSNNNNHHQITSSSLLPSLSKCIIAKTFISILQLPIRLNTIDGYYYLPETFHTHNDSIRLSLLRDLIDRISIVSSIMITVRQLLVKYQIPPNCIDVKSELELHYRYVCMFVCMCMHVCMYVRMHVCMYVCFTSVDVGG
jgi:hypothetical protein